MEIIFSYFYFFRTSCSNLTLDQRGWVELTAALFRLSILWTYFATDYCSKLQERRLKVELTGTGWCYHFLEKDRDMKHPIWTWTTCYKNNIILNYEKSSQNSLECIQSILINVMYYTMHIIQDSQEQTFVNNWTAGGSILSHADNVTLLLLFTAKITYWEIKNQYLYMRFVVKLL